MNGTKDTRFKAGESGNPAGRPPGTGQITKLRQSLYEHVPEIVGMLVEQAKGGDVGAARLILERVLPPVKAVEASIQVDLPEGGSLTSKANAVLQAASTGELGTSQASQLIAAIGAFSKIHETDELEQRIKRLEEQHAKH